MLSKSSVAGQHSVKKSSIFFIISFLIVLLLAIHVLTTTQVTQYSPGDLGLLTKLPITFWIGLAYLGVLLYLGRKSGQITIIVAVLIFFYLFCIPLLIRENKAEFLSLSYGFAYKGTWVWSTGHLDFGTYNWLSLLNWPGFFIFAGSISGVTGLPATLFADYFPLLTMALMGIVVYYTLRVRLNQLASSFGALWFIASFWTIQYYFAPQGFAYLFYFAIFLLLTRLFFNKKQNLVLSLIVLVLFFGLVTTHLLTSFALTGSIIIVYALSKIFPQKRKMVIFYSIGTCILLMSILLAYQFFVINSSFSEIIKMLYSQLSQGETHLTTISQGRTFVSPSLNLQLFGDYAITIINVGMAIIAILAIFVGALRKKEKARQDLFWVAWIIVAVLIAVSMMYGGEIIQRAFILMLLPISYFAASFFRKKPRIMVFVLIAIVFLQVPAHYAWENWGYVPTSEIKGTAFFEKYAPLGASFLYEPSLGYFKEELNLVSITVASPGGGIPNSTIINGVVGRANFIISSNQLDNFYQYFFGVNLLENVSLADNFNQVYDNEFFQIYSR